MKGREIVDFINKKGLLDEDLFLTDAYGNTYGYMTVEEYAANIGAGTAVVEALLKRGDVPFVKIFDQTLIPDNTRIKIANRTNVSGMNEPAQSYIVSIPNVGYGINLISELKSILEDYGTVTIADLCGMIGARYNAYMDNLYGWTNFGDGLDIKPVGFGLVIELPAPIRLGV